MKMRKIAFCVLISMLGWNFSVNAASRNVTTYPKEVHISNDDKLNIQEAERIIQRIEEINKMDKENLTSVEKKTLRNEILNIKKKMNYGGGPYIYIGGGTLILIIILLIIFL